MNVKQEQEGILQVVLFIARIVDAKKSNRIAQTVLQSV